MMLGSDGKPFKTRSGGTVKLVELLDEAVERARKLLAERGTGLTADELNDVARKVGIGAVKYADLSKNRTTDYVFNWDTMMSFEGNTAPYLQYAVARIHSIFRKLNSLPTDSFTSARVPESDPERKLSRKLLFFPLVLKQATRELKPHFLCTYLYELATEFSSFYNQEKVMVDEKDTRNLRLLLCASTQAVLTTGLGLLGIETLEEM